MKCDMCNKECALDILQHVKGRNKLEEHHYEEVDLYVCTPCNVKLTNHIARTSRHKEQTEKYEG